MFLLHTYFGGIMKVLRPKRVSATFYVDSFVQEHLPTQMFYVRDQVHHLHVEFYQIFSK